MNNAGRGRLGGIGAWCVVLGILLSPAVASADPTPWRATQRNADDGSSGVFPRARELLTRAKALEDEATTEERQATELAQKLPTLRANAKAARDRAERAGLAESEKETLTARAEEAEAELVVSEAEASYKKRHAVENRKAARELRAQAVAMVKTGSSQGIASGPMPAPRAVPVRFDPCDPPFRFSADGHKIYPKECIF